MKKYVVTAVKAVFNPGAVLELSPEQAAPRKDLLQKKGRNTYEVSERVEFKRGEEIGFEGEANKIQLQLVADAGSEQAAEVKAKKASPKAEKETAGKGKAVSKPKKKAPAPAPEIEDGAEAETEAEDEDEDEDEESGAADTEADADDDAQPDGLMV